MRHVITAINGAVLALGLAACSHGSSGGSGTESEPFETPLPEDLSSVAARHDELLSRLDAFVEPETGWVTIRRNGAPDLEGDTLLWHGLALSVADCPRADLWLIPVENMSDHRGGGWVRYEPLPDELHGNEVSRDGVTGMMVGLWSVWNRCETLRPRVEDLWRSFVAFVDDAGRGLILYPNASRGLITSTMQFAMDVMSHRLLGHANPSGIAKTKAALGEELNASGTSRDKDPCYPLHIGALQVLLVGKAGNAYSTVTMGKWCAETAETDVPLLDWMCGRAPAEPWLAATDAASPWSYRNQRCGQWEEPDLKAGEESPRLDWLVLYDLASGAW